MERLGAMILNKTLAATKASVQAIRTVVEWVFCDCECVVPTAVRTQQANITLTFEPEQLFQVSVDICLPEKERIISGNGSASFCRFADARGFTCGLIKANSFGCEVWIHPLEREDTILVFFLKHGGRGWSMNHGSAVVWLLAQQGWHVDVAMGGCQTVLIHFKRRMALGNLQRHRRAGIWLEMRVVMKCLTL